MKRRVAQRVSLVILLFCMLSMCCTAVGEGPLAGKIIFLAGDSRSSDDYTFYGDLLAAKTGANVLVMGQSGATAAQFASDAYLERVTANPHDYCIVLIGGNDTGEAGTVGTFDHASVNGQSGEPLVEEPDLDADYNGTAFIQCLYHFICRWQRDVAPSGAVLLLCTDLPQQRYDSESVWSDPENLQRKNNAIRECAMLCGVTLVDLCAACDFDMSMEPYFVPPTDKENDRGVYFMDGLHPNRRGFDVITDVLVNELVDE